MFRNYRLLAAFLGILVLAIPAASQNFQLELPTFEGALNSEVPAIDGRSIQEIIVTGQPIFPPIEGLPEEFWKDQQCSSCHNWTRPDVCFQGNLYASGAPRKLHPMGGAFKDILQFWAELGCL